MSFFTCVAVGIRAWIPRSFSILHATSIFPPTFSFPSEDASVFSSRWHRESPFSRQGTRLHGVFGLVGESLDVDGCFDFFYDVGSHRLRHTFHVHWPRTSARLVVAAMAQTRRTSVVWVDEDAKDDKTETGGASERVVDLTVAGHTPKRRKKPEEECVIVRETKVRARNGTSKVNQNVWKETKERQSDASEGRREPWPRFGRWEHDVDVFLLVGNG